MSAGDGGLTGGGGLDRGDQMVGGSGEATSTGTRRQLLEAVLGIGRVLTGDIDGVLDHAALPNELAGKQPARGRPCRR